MRDKNLTNKIFDLQKKICLKFNFKIKLNNLKFPPVDIEKVKMIREDLQTAMKGLLAKGHAIENITWFKVPFAQVGNLVRNRSVYLEQGFAFVPEERLTEFIVGKFRAALSKERILNFTLINLGGSG